MLRDYTKGILEIVSFYPYHNPMKQVILLLSSWRKGRVSDINCHNLLKATKYKVVELGFEPRSLTWAYSLPVRLCGPHQGNLSWREWSASQVSELFQERMEMSMSCFNGVSFCSYMFPRNSSGRLSPPRPCPSLFSINPTINKERMQSSILRTIKMWKKGPFLTRFPHEIPSISPAPHQDMARKDLGKHGVTELWDNIVWQERSVTVALLREGSMHGSDLRPITALLAIMLNLCPLLSQRQGMWFEQVKIYFESTANVNLYNFLFKAEIPESKSKKV